MWTWEHTLLAAGTSDAAPLAVAFWIKALLWWLLPWVAPIVLLCAVFYFTLSQPLRRRERARFLLEVVEAAAREGQPVEHRIIALGRTREPSLGVSFHLLATYLEQGHTLASALKHVPRMATLQMAAILDVGEVLGDYRKVLPACRQLLLDGPARTFVAMNYQVLLAFVLNPIILLITPFLSAKIIPVFGEILAGFGVPRSDSSQIPLHLMPSLFWLQLALVLGVWLVALVLFGGPGLMAWAEAGLAPFYDRLMARIAWRRKRLQRDFSTMLGLLLDAGVPEARAVKLAAASTGNQAFIRRARQVVTRLQAGMKLAEAMRVMENSDEFLWRLANGAHAPHRFAVALRGWHESLSAQAYRQEQAAAQLLTTLLILLNGVSVALVAGGVWQLLSHINALH